MISTILIHGMDPKKGVAIVHLYMCNSNESSSLSLCDLAHLTQNFIFLDASRAASVSIGIEDCTKDPGHGL